MQQLAHRLVEAISSLHPALGVAILSAAPISEFRGGIPYGIVVGHMSLAEVLPIAILSCMLPAIPIFLGFNWVTNRLADKPLLGSIVQRGLKHVREKGERMQKWGIVGLVLFAGIPLPGFGVYTAAAIAAVLAIPFGRAVVSMLIGVTLGSILVAGLSLGGVQMFEALKAAQ